MHNIKSNNGKVYDNCVIQAPDGTPVARCGRKKLNWFLSRGLATPINNDVIRLNFQPRACLNTKEALEPKDNICVVCGITKKLSKHHIVPACFRNAMPVGWRAGAALFHDVIALCVSCHAKYETEAMKLKKELSVQHGISLHGSEAIVDANRELVGRYARTILDVPRPGKRFKKKKKHVKPPQEYINKLKSKIADYLGRSPTEEDLQEMIHWTSIVTGPNNVPYGKAIIDRVDCGEFVLMWREHFLNTMNPKYMPDFWEKDRLPTPEEIQEVEIGVNPVKEGRWKYNKLT